MQTTISSTICNGHLPARPRPDFASEQPPPDRYTRSRHRQVKHILFCRRDFGLRYRDYRLASDRVMAVPIVMASSQPTRRKTIAINSVRPRGFQSLSCPIPGSGNSTSALYSAGLNVG